MFRRIWEWNKRHSLAKDEWTERSEPTELTEERKRSISNKAMIAGAIIGFVILVMLMIA